MTWAIERERRRRGRRPATSLADLDLDPPYPLSLRPISRWRERRVDGIDGTSSRHVVTAVASPTKLPIPHPLSLSPASPPPRQVFKSTASKAGVPWDGTFRALTSDPALRAIKAELEDARIVYPAYYTVPFHAYEAGNLSWEAAAEVESATQVTALRTFRGTDPGLSPDAAQARLRANIHAAITAYAAEQDGGPGASPASPPYTSILDVGCSVGVSTRHLAAAWPGAAVTGLDLSPYFLAVAELRERQREAGVAPAPHSNAGPACPGRARIAYVHANAEATRLAPASFDLVNSTFVVHECRPYAIEGMAGEAFRLLRAGGTYAVTDNNPASATIQNLPAPLFTMMKATEPWSDEYYAADIEAILRGAGFVDVRTEEADHRHRVVLGRKPA